MFLNPGATARKRRAGRQACLSGDGCGIALFHHIPQPVRGGWAAVSPPSARLTEVKRDFRAAGADSTRPTASGRTFPTPHRTGAGERHLVSAGLRFANQYLFDFTDIRCMQVVLRVKRGRSSLGEEGLRRHRLAIELLQSRTSFASEK